MTLYQIAVAYAESNQSYSNDYNTYTSVWGVGPTTNQAYAIANLEVNNGYTLQNIRSLLVYSPTTVSNVSTIYTNALGRADTPQDLAAQQSFLLNGGNIYGSTGVVGSVVFSQECAGDISSFYALILCRPANPDDIAYNQNFLANGTSLCGLRTMAAYCPESSNNITAFYASILGRTANAGDIAYN